MCDGSSGREERRAGGKREARERRVWTARRVVVGRASHDELFFKIASTSPTTRKQKKPENSLSTRSFSRSQRDDKGCLGECDDEMSRLGMCSDVKGRGGIGWCKAIGDGGGFVSVCADPGLPLALMCLPLLPPAVADAVAALGEKCVLAAAITPCGAIFDGRIVGGGRKISGCGGHGPVAVEAADEGLAVTLPAFTDCGRRGESSERLPCGCVNGTGLRVGSRAVRIATAAPLRSLACLSVNSAIWFFCARTSLAKPSSHCPLCSSRIRSHLVIRPFSSRRMRHRWTSSFFWSSSCVTRELHAQTHTQGTT